MNLNTQADMAIKSFDVSQHKNLLLTDLLLAADMNKTTAERFKQVVYGYCKENLIKLGEGSI